MSYLRRGIARVGYLFRTDRADDEMHEELEAHLAMESAENVRRGMTPEAARRHALLAAGGLDQAAEAVRDQRGLPRLESVAADLRYAVRTLRRNPAFSIIVILTLALGIGANTAIFSVVRGVLLEPLPHRDGDRLVYLRQSTDAPAGSDIGFSVPEVRDLREGVRSISGMAEYSPWTVLLRDDETVTRLRVALVTGNYFEVMGLAPVLGRVTEARDDGPGVERVAVLTHDFWVRRFGGDTAIVGSQLRLDGKLVAVIGVLEPAPFHPAPIDVLLNMVNSDHHLSATMVEGRTHRMTQVVARVGPGAAVGQAREEVASVYAAMQAGHAEAYDAGSRYRIAVVPFADVLGERARLTLWLLMSAATFVLIISVASVANLTLMRGVRREHELVLRAALGAGVTRLRRLLLAENLLLALLGAAVGVLITVAGFDLLVSFAERQSPRASEIRLDGPVFGFMLTLSLGVALLLSLLAVLPREGRFAARILSGPQRVTGHAGRQRLQRGFVVVQVAVSVVLLAGAGLLTRTLVTLSNVSTGLSTEEILMLDVPLLATSEILSNPAADGIAKQRYEEIRLELARIPGVIEAAVGSPGPLQSSSVSFDVKAEDRPTIPGEAIPVAELRTAGVEFFRASGIPLVRGREFRATDRKGAASVVIINELLADVLFPGEDPIGRRMAWTGDVLRFTPISSEWRTIVGVARNTQDGGPDTAPRSVVYMPFDQLPAMGGSFVVRAESNVAALLPAVTRIVRRITPGAPIENVFTIAQFRDESIAPRRLNAVLVSAFGLLAVIIAAVGIAGVLAFSVSARTHEIGVRMGLGADSGRVQRMILKEGGVLLALGLVIGIVGAALAARVIEGLLFGVEPNDPATFASVALLMAAIGVSACWLPALRAARIDPAVTMRAQ